MSHIVVGVDGSDVSHAAFWWAVAEADRHGLPLQVVHVYNTASMYLSEVAGYVDVGRLVETIRDEAEAVVGNLVATAVREHPHVAVTPVTVDAPNPAQTLRDHASDAAMLVVGTRGRGGFAGLVLGSVSHQCVSHPPCPVVVVPPGD